MYDTGAIRIVSLPTEKNYSHIPVDEYEQEPTAYADAFWINLDMLSFENGICYFDFIKDLIWTGDSYRTQWFIGGLSNYRYFICAISYVFVIKGTRYY